MVASTWTVTAAVGPARWRTSGLTTRCMIASSTRLNVTPTTANVTKSRNPLLKPMNGFNDGTAREANRARAYHPGPMRVTHRAGRGHWAPAAFAAIGAATALVLALPLPSGSAAAPPAAPTSPSGAPLPAASVSQTTGRWFDRVFVVVLENKDRSDVLDVPYFAELARRGEQFPRFVGETPPSQPNSLAMVGGDTFVRGDEPHDITATNLADLLEGAGMSWTSYEEGLPEPCFTGKAAGNSQDGKYTRAHNPFVSFDDIRTNPERCARIVDGERLDADI